MRAKSGGGVVVMVCALWVTASACGDDDGGGAKDAGAAGLGGTGGAGMGGTGGAGMGGTGGSGLPPIVPLGDNVAGKPCSSAADCGSGTCAMQITGAALGPATAPGGYCTGECETNAHCGAGGVCVGAIPNLVRGECFESCTGDDDCREEYLCTTSISFAGIVIPSTCRPKPMTDQLEDGVAGTMCTADADCGDGTCAMTRAGLFGGGTALPGGYCTGACLEDSHCGAGAVCSPPLLEGLAGACYQSCESDADCTRDGYRCREVSTGLRGCDAFPDPLPDDTAGKACAADADCGGEMGTCVTALPAMGLPGAFGQTLPAPDGYCTQICADEADCGAGGVCATSALGTGRCYAPCTTEADCRDGYVCEARGMGGPAMGDAGATPAMTVCVPAPPPMDGGVPDASIANDAAIDGG